MTPPASAVTPASPPPPTPAARRGSKFTICMAVILVLMAVVFGARSFREITAEEPASTLDVSPVKGKLPGRSAKEPVAEGPASDAEFLAATEAPASPAAPVPPEPVAAPPLDAKVPPSPPIAVSNPVQTLPPSALPPSAQPTSRIQPPDSPASSKDVSATASGVVIPVVASAGNSNAVAPASSESDTVLLDEVRTLERRGDEIMAEKRFEDALDLYRTALDSAEEYATRNRGGNSATRDHVVALTKKLAILQMQNTSTAEARATYRHARKVLLQLKSQGNWNRERAKALDEVESRLLSLPQD